MFSLRCRMFPFFPRLVVLAILLASAGSAGTLLGQTADRNEPSVAPKLILEGARREAWQNTPYIMEYRTMKYPGGDVPAGTGVCTDLVIRAFRNAGYDLQSLLHEDRRDNPKAYPTHIWENKKPDKHIDHRRCQNLAVWFRRHTMSLPTEITEKTLKEWKGGDVVFFVHQGKEYPWHVAIVSDITDAGGVPLVIDSFPPHTSESHRLDQFGPIHSHFRVGSELKRNHIPAAEPPKSAEAVR